MTCSKILSHQLPTYKQCISHDWRLGLGTTRSMTPTTERCHALQDHQLSCWHPGYIFAHSSWYTHTRGHANRFFLSIYTATPSLEDYEQAYIIHTGFAGWKTTSYHVDYTGVIKFRQHKHTGFCSCLRLHSFGSKYHSYVALVVL